MSKAGVRRRCARRRSARRDPRGRVERLPALLHFGAQLLPRQVLVFRHRKPQRVILPVLREAVGRDAPAGVHLVPEARARQGVRNNALSISIPLSTAASAICRPIPGMSQSRPMMYDPTTPIRCRWMRRRCPRRSPPFTMLYRLPISASPSFEGDSNPMNTPKHPARRASSRSSSSSAKLIVAWQTHRLPAVRRRSSRASDPWPGRHAPAACR